MKSFLPFSIFIGICCLLIGSATSAAVDNLSPETNHELARARSATAKYHDFDRADADGYEFLHCVPGEGFEYVNWSLVDCNFDIEHPEALHYIAEGTVLRLVGVEYVVPVACTATAPEGFTGDDDEWEFMAEGFAHLGDESRDLAAQPGRYVRRAQPTQYQTNVHRFH